MSMDSELKNKEASKEKKKKEQQKVKVVTVFYAGVFFVVAYFILVAVAIYIFNVDNLLTRKTAKIIPYPAAFCDSDFIRLSELKDKTNSVKRFYENQDFSDLGTRIDFNTADGQKRLKIKEKYILNKIVENKIIEKEAKEVGIVLTDEMISQEVDRKVVEYGSENYLKENMARLYGWSIEDFKENIVKPDMYREKLAQNIRENNSDFREAREKISKAFADVSSKKDFSEVARKYSEGDSAKEGGELGWFEFEQMLPEIAQAVGAMEKGDVSEIVESSLGYHIIMLEDKKNENEKNMFKVRQIFIRTKNFGEWLAEQEKGASVHILLKDYYWNKDSLSVEFKNMELESFEKNLRKNFPNDISIMF